MRILELITFMKQLSLKFKSHLILVSERIKQIEFLPSNPLNGIQLRLDVVQSTIPHPTWCSVMWYDLYLPIYLMRYFHAFFGGIFQIHLSSGEILQDINSYEDKISFKITNEIEYEAQIEKAEIECINIGENVKIYVNPTYSYYPYEDAITYSICVNGFKETDYNNLAEGLKAFLRKDYETEII
ncbi:MAG: hypothetical protein IKA09_07350 [Lachnospiraceae bacterium]|nr:hypothetical protein [Lachnospiraceae bacterium]